MKVFKKVLVLALLVLGLSLALTFGMKGTKVKKVVATTTYEQLTSIASIDESAQYVLGVDGTGFHYSGTSSWGLTALPNAQTPYYYTLTKAQDGESFTATTVISETTYYLQIPTSNTFGMTTTAGTNTDLIIGTTKVASPNYAVANKGTTDRHLRRNGDSGLRSYASTTGAMAFFYKVVETSDPSVTISGDAYNMVGQANKTLTANSENFDHPGSAVWTSSNEAVATVTSGGVVELVGVGTTTITATVTDTQDANVSAHASVTYKVYPANASAITIAEAVAIAELAGETETPYNYTIDRVTVTNAASPSMVVSDGNNTIIVFKYNHGKAVNDLLQVTGKLINYGGTTPEFTSNPVITNYYTVTFDSNGGSEVDSQVILGGEKASEPADPTKANYDFASWKLNDVAYDFNSTVTGNITLVATWTSNILSAFETKLNLVDAHMSLAYTYKWTEASADREKDVITNAFLGLSGKSYTDWEKTGSSSVVYKGNSFPHASAVQLRSSGDSGIIATTSAGKASMVVVKWNNSTADNRTLDIYGKNTAYSATSNLYSDDASVQGTKLGSIVKGTSDRLVITGEYEYIGLRSNNGAMYFDEIDIIWNNYTYSEEEFLVKCAIDDILVDAVASDPSLNGAEYVYGIEVSTSTKTVKYASNNAKFHSETVSAEDYKYVVINLGAVMSNMARLDEEFTVRAYVTYGGDTIYSTLTKTYSVIDMIKIYKANDQILPLIQDFVDELEYLGYNLD